MSNTIDVKDIAKPERLADQISQLFMDWNNYRTKWLSEQSIKNSYLHATSTKETQVGEATEWKNNTTIPKLTQIRDNLHANYMATLFPNDNWLYFEATDFDEDSDKKAKVATAYVKHKFQQAQQRSVVSQLVLDWIDYGNCFAMPVYVDEAYEIDGEVYDGYTGFKIIRISPYDIVFNPLANSFEETPKIIRSIKTLGELKNDIENKPEMNYLQGAFDLMIEKRKAVTAQISQHKNKSLQNSGLGGIEQYYDSPYVEILDFYGDIYDEESGKLLKNYCVSVVDRSVIIRKKPNPSWLGKSPIYHVGWRQRADSLYAQSPLDNLVGMQFMLDKSQNVKADILDQNVHPMWKVKGAVEDFELEPNGRIYIPEDGDVQPLRPDQSYVTISNNELILYQQLMEEMAGAPKQAMGFRTAGEKTKFEVQVLDRATNRIFLHKTSYFEEVFLEPLLNACLELSRRNLTQAETIKMKSDKFSVDIFQSVSREDLASKGVLRPLGARRFAEQANKLQEYMQLINMASSNPVLSKHLVGLEVITRLFELAGLDDVSEVVRRNAQVIEEVDAQSTAQTAQRVVAEQQVSLPDETELEGVESDENLVNNVLNNGQ